ncbi:MAG: hypothetical protein AAB152_18080 [Candidatus Coatesbacteria bacterium]
MMAARSRPEDVIGVAPEPEEAAEGLSPPEIVLVYGGGPQRLVGIENWPRPAGMPKK